MVRHDGIVRPPDAECPRHRARERGAAAASGSRAAAPDGLGVASPPTGLVAPLPDRSASSGHQRVWRRMTRC